jgi:hypothetical protein
MPFHDRIYNVYATLGAVDAPPWSTSIWAHISEALMPLVEHAHGRAAMRSCQYPDIPSAYQWMRSFRRSKKQSPNESPLWCGSSTPNAIARRAGADRLGEFESDIQRYAIILFRAAALAHHVTRATAARTAAVLLKQMLI